MPLGAVRRAAFACAAVLAAATTGCSSPKPEVYAPAGNGTAGGERFQLGIDVMASGGFQQLRGKRVGLIANQTSVDGSGTPTRLVLKRAPQVNLVALFAPEHGIDGKAKAGVKVASTRDRLTGLPVHSLYGDTRKPTPAMLSGIDVLLFDLQDIGCRSYTYISTMARAMEACGERGVEFIVLDRPNPLGGLRVEGPPLERKWQSFVGEVPVPYVHGMTAGELALMIHGEGWKSSNPHLGVVKMRGWNRRMTWADTGLRWVPTSPNIPHQSSPLYYVATGMLGGLEGVDIGIGTSGPFEYAGSRGIDEHDLARAMRARGFSGVSFTPYQSSNRPGFSGVKMHIEPGAAADLTALDVALVYELNRRTKGAIFSRASSSKMSLFHKVYGSESLARDIRSGKSPQSIAASWVPSVNRFRSGRARYLLYGQ